MAGTPVVIGYPHRGDDLHHVFAKSMFSSLTLSNQRAQQGLPWVAHIVSSESCYIVKNRNRLVRMFLDTPYEWLLMIDTDMEFEPDLLTELFKVAHPVTAPIVAGACAVVDPAGNRILVWYQQVEDGVYRQARFDPRHKAVHLDAAGTGCLLVHRSVFERILSRQTEPDEWVWFDQPSVNGKRIGEDMAFCRRAVRLGFSIWGCPMAVLKHHKTTPIVPDFTAGLSVSRTVVPATEKVNAYPA